MIYDHSLVGDWRDRVGKEEKASEQALHRFIDLKQGRTRPKSACDPLKYTARNGPWSSGQNYADARFDQPFPDMVERRILQNVQHFERTGFGKDRHITKILFGETAKSRPATAASTRRSTQRSTQRSQRSHNSGAFTPGAAVDPTLRRISPLTEPTLVQKETLMRTGLCKRREWDHLETDPVKQQLEQECLISTLGHQTHIDLCGWSPLTKPAVSGTTPRGVIKPAQYTKKQLELQQSAQRFKDTKKPRERTSSGYRPSSSSSRRSASRGGRTNVGQLMSRMKAMEHELDSARHHRKEVEDQVEQLMAKT